MKPDVQVESVVPAGPNVVLPTNEDVEDLALALFKAWLLANQPRYDCYWEPVARAAFAWFAKR
jgi:hypothetical protein